MMFDLKKYSDDVAVETEYGVCMTYAQLDDAAGKIASKMEQRQFTYSIKIWHEIQVTL